MKYLAILAAAMTLLLSGCATTINSDVTVFHEWPSDLQDKSYVFTTPPPRQDTLEYRTYQNLLRGQLGKLGFTEADSTDHAKLRVAMRFFTVDHPIVLIEAYDPYFAGPAYWPGRFGYGYGRFGRAGFYGPYGGYGRYGYYGPYDPFFYGPPSVEESMRHIYQRTLHVTIGTSDGKQLYDVTAQNSSLKPATAAVMPALMVSAFSGFPGQSGVPHRVELKQDN